VTDGSDTLSALDELLDRAVAAINRGDRATATKLAGQVLTVDGDNTDAASLLAAPAGRGEIRRMSMLFADIVDSTALSTRLEPEDYRIVMGRYREDVQRIIAHFGGYAGSIAGDGLLVVFGYPQAHENDVQRAVAAALEITRAVTALSELARRRFGVDLGVRVGVHRGVVYFDTVNRDVFGLGANLASRVSSLAPPNTVVVSAAIASLVRDEFDLAERPPAPVKGVDGLIDHFLVVGERLAPDRVLHGPLVGRDAEMAKLHDAWEMAVAGALATPGIVLRGDAGIGKSRLVGEATVMVEGSGARTVELTGSPFHTSAGLHPVRALLQRRSGITRGTGSAERISLLEAHIVNLGLDPTSFVPLLAPVVGFDSDTGYDTVQAEGRRLYELIAEAVRDYLLASLGGGTGLIVAEDAHWFDATTLEILGSLLDRTDGRLMVIVTGRPGDWLPGGWPVDVVELSPLSNEHSDAMVVAINPTLSALQRAAVVARCDGVPFYIEQVVEGLSESGVPEALYEPLFARLRVDANVLPVIEAAAVIGRLVDRQLLCSVVDLEPQQVDQIVGEFEGALVLEAWGPDVWRFRHELLRETAAELAPPSVRRALHGRVGDALADASSPDWSLIADHYGRAERFDHAADACERALADAWRRGAVAEARTYLTRAIDLLDRVAPGPEHDRHEIRLRLQRGCMPASPEVYQSGAQGKDFERCLELGGASLTKAEMRATVTPLALFFITRGDLARAVQVIDALGAGLARDSDSFGSLVEGLYGAAAWYRGEFEAAQPLLESATASVADVGIAELEALWYLPNEPRAMGLHHLALTRLMRGDVAGAEAELARARGWIGQLAFPQGPYSLAYASFIESWIYLETGQLDRALTSAVDAMELGQRHGFDAWLVIGATQRAAVAAVMAIAAGEDLTGHVETMTGLVNTWRAMRLMIYLPLFDAVVGRLLLAAGDAEAARECFDTALQTTAETDLRFYDAELLRLRAHTQADVAAALSLAASQGATIFELRATLDDFELRGERARVALVDVLGRVPSDSALPEVARARKLLGN
jgi:class 3 adenylate cyclase/tetratricopeptide (TPR) repeat protein